MEEVVAKLILDSLDNTPTKGSLGDIFQVYIESLKEKESSLNERDKELATKLKFLKQCEVANDLGWFDYNSWNTFPKALQDLFLLKIETLYYGGVFFQYSKLVEFEKEIWKLLPTSHIVTIMNDNNNYHLVCIGPEDLKYGWLGDNAMKDIQKKFRKQTIRSIGVNEMGQIIEKLVDRTVPDVQ